jgi:hypothetical protein
MGFTGILGTIDSQPGQIELAFVPGLDLPWFRQPQIQRPADGPDADIPSQRNLAWLFTSFVPPPVDNLPWRHRQDPQAEAQEQPAKRGIGWLFSPMRAPQDVPWLRRPRFEDPAPAVDVKKPFPTIFQPDDLAWRHKRYDEQPAAPEDPARRVNPAILTPITPPVVDSLPWLRRRQAAEVAPEQPVSRQINPLLFTVDYLAWYRRKPPAEEEKQIEVTPQRWKPDLLGPEWVPSGRKFAPEIRPDEILAPKVNPALFVPITPPAVDNLPWLRKPYVELYPEYFFPPPPPHVSWNGEPPPPFLPFNCPYLPWHPDTGKSWALGSAVPEVVTQAGERTEDQIVNRSQPERMVPVFGKPEAIPSFAARVDPSPALLTRPDSLSPYRPRPERQGTLLDRTDPVPPIKSAKPESPPAETPAKPEALPEEHQKPETCDEGTTTPGT